nr:MAG TPA_asm: hypothetical protein [Caudoviricetes sp.]
MRIACQLLNKKLIVIYHAVIDLHAFVDFMSE